MNISKEISIDIIQYLHQKKGTSIDDIAKSMSTTPDHIQNIIDYKSTLQIENIDNYLQNKNVKFWQFASETIPVEHLSPKIRNKIQLCRELSEYIEKKKH